MMVLGVGSTMTTYTVTMIDLRTSYQMGVLGGSKKGEFTAIFAGPHSSNAPAVANGTKTVSFGSGST